MPNRRRGLWRSYRAAHYVVQAEPAFVLRVDHRSAALQALQRRYGVARSAFLTACNPRSQRFSAAANLRLRRQLEALVQRRGYVSLAGYGTDPAGRWGVEESLLIVGISTAEALGLARRFGQNALLVMAADAVPRLLWVLR